MTEDFEDVSMEVSTITITLIADIDGELDVAVGVTDSTPLVMQLGMLEEAKENLRDIDNIRRNGDDLYEEE